MKLFILIILIIFNYATAIEYSCPNEYYSLSNICHKGNIYFSSGLCLNKDKNIKEYNQIYGNSNIYSPCPIDWITLSWGYQKIFNNTLTLCSCELKQDNSVQFYQIGNCGENSIEFNSMILSFTNENHFLNIFTCSQNNSPNLITTTTIFNSTSIQLNHTSTTTTPSTSFNCLNGSINIFTWDYGSDICPLGLYGTFCQFRDYCYLNVCGENGECENTDNIGKGYNCTCKEGYKFNGTECEIDTCYIKNFQIDCGYAKCNLTTNHFIENGIDYNILYYCYCDKGYILQNKIIGNQFIKYCQKEGECANSTMCGMADCKNDGQHDNCVCLNEKTHLFISDNGDVSCVDNSDSSKWKIPVSIMVSVIGLLFIFCISMFIYVKFFKYKKSKTITTKTNNNNNYLYDDDDNSLDSQPLL
ncbi:hypothetical protein ACTFIR_003398 [Dictyostelium discoideum]